MENTYKTSDYNLAVYLYASGLKFIKIEGTTSDLVRCNFVFEVPEGISLTSLLVQWSGSETDKIREVLYKSKKLKSHLKDYLSLTNKR